MVKSTKKQIGRPRKYNKDVCKDEYYKNTKKWKDANKQKIKDYNKMYYNKRKLDKLNKLLN